MNGWRLFGQNIIIFYSFQWIFACQESSYPWQILIIFQESFKNSRNFSGILQKFQEFFRKPLKIPKIFQESWNCSKIPGIFQESRNAGCPAGCQKNLQVRGTNFFNAISPTFFVSNFFYLFGKFLTHCAKQILIFLIFSLFSFFFFFLLFLFSSPLLFSPSFKSISPTFSVQVRGTMCPICP